MFNPMKRIKAILSAVLMLASASAFAQINVSGVVTDSNGEPLAGATVYTKDARTGTATDVDGKWQLKNVGANETIVASCVGYHTAEQVCNGRSVVNFTLELDSQMLEETIVVAFGTSTKEAFTGSAKTLKDETLANSQVTSITDALAGQVAGVQLTSSNGAPGATSSIRIRGIGSIYAGNSPLIVVDGAPFDGDMNTISPSDVESITVLKDAASNALYGARGANGVIMITTKKAKSGSAIVTFDAKVGVNSKAVQQYDIVSDPRAYYELHAQALNNYYLSEGLSAPHANAMVNNTITTGDNGGLGYPIFSIPEGQSLIGLNGKLNPGATLGNVIGDFYVTPDDWSKAAYRKGLRQEYSLGVSGAYDKFSVFASLNYLNNQGIVEKSDYDRLGARLKAEYQAKSWLKVGANLSFSHYKQNSLTNNGNDTSTGNVLAFTQLMAPIYPLYVRNADGSQYYDKNGVAVLDFGNGSLVQGGVPGTARPFLSNSNPLFGNRHNTYEVTGNSATANGFLEFKIIDGLTVNINATAYLDEYRTRVINNSYYGQFRSEGGNASVEHGRTFSYNFQQLINYSREVAPGHNIGLMLGHENYVNRGYGLWASKSKMFSVNNKELNGFVVDSQGAGSSQSMYNNEGYFFRAQYDYAERYFVSGSYRRDASSKFHPDHRWGNFWSAGAAWIISKENWFDVNGIDELKLKASVGSQGNDNIGNYRYVDTYDIANSDGEVSTIFASKGNKEITWETNTNINAGLEFSFLKGKISGSVEYFNRLTTNMLFPVPVAPSNGYTSIWQNVGDMSNQGAELDLHITPIQTRNITWDITLNATYLNNRIMKLADKVKQTTVYDANLNEYKGYTSGSFFMTEGERLNTLYTYEFAGVDQETGKSLWYRTVTDDKGNPTGRETTDDYSKASRYITHKSTLAPMYGGFGTSLKAYGFDLAVNFTYQLGGSQFDGTYQSFMNSPVSSVGGNYHVDLYKSWTPAAHSNTIPRFQYLDTYANATSTRFLTSASYLNLQNINVGYTFPERWTKNILVSSLRLYFSAENVWYWAARKGFDPRQGYSAGTTASNYSPMRTLSGGITVKF